MRDGIAALTVGFIFALGLGLSGMTQPEKVVGFLDILGNWDPSLMFVMVGAIAVHFVSYRLIRKRNSPLFSMKWHVPHKTEITAPLIFGAVIFGIGWGLSGFCPGPAVTALASLSVKPLIFVLSMVGGMLLFRVFDQRVLGAKRDTE